MNTADYWSEIGKKLDGAVTRNEVEQIVEQKLFEMIPLLSPENEDYSASTEDIAAANGCSQATIRKYVREGVFTAQEVLAKGSNFSFRPLAARRRLQEHSAQILSISSGIPEQKPNNVLNITRRRRKAG